MSEFLIQSETLDNIADAINAKTGGSSAMTPAEMVTAIAAIPSGGGITPTGTKQISITQNGTTTEDVTQYANAEITVNVPSGGSLPSSISKVDGGSFTFVSDTTVTEQITHNLGVIPTGVMVWCDVDPYPNMYFGGLFNNPANNNVFRVIGYRTGSTMDRNTSYRGTAPLADMLTSEFWSLYHGSYKYKGGITYKWIAWA